ncbi:MAG: hypothetical protein HOB02_03320 [Proteobacteria bacterium]|nr:hypothetical protein [Pseudomonadota bacterium]
MFHPRGLNFSIVFVVRAKSGMDKKPSTEIEMITAIIATVLAVTQYPLNNEKRYCSYPQSDL